MKKGAFEALRLVAALEDALRKFELLLRVNQSEDNSSELAGFEINKLLKEQAKLETQYNELIDRRKRLNHIEHRAEYLAVQAEIVAVSRSLKESMKKLSRLFKENKNLGEDSQKVAGEQQEAARELTELVSLIRANTLDEYEDQILAQLQSHYELDESQAREKALSASVRNLRAAMADTQKVFAVESAEKDENIKRLREAVLRTRAESSVVTEYRHREFEADEQTVQRLQVQEREALQQETLRLEELQRREEETFAKAQRVLEAEQARLQAEVEHWKAENERTHEELESQTEAAQAALEADTIRLITLKRWCEEELALLKAERKRVQQLAAGRTAAEERQSQTDLSVRKIQHHFEQWFVLVGQFARRKKPKKAAQK